MNSDTFDASREQVQSKTIKERIEGAVIDLYEYRKFAEHKLKNKLLTGHTIDLCLCKDNDICIINFDIDHAGKLNEEEKEKIRQNIFNIMLHQNVWLIQTAKGGIYAYCNRNRYKLPSSKNEKIVTYEDNLEIDIFAQIYAQKYGKLVENRVVLPDRKVRIMDKGIQKKEILHYKELNDWSNATHPVLLYDILGKWNLELIAKGKDFRIFNEDCTPDIMLVELSEVCFEGLIRLTNHKDTNTFVRKLKHLIIKIYEAKEQEKKETIVKSIEKNEIDLIDPFTLKDNVGKKIEIDIILKELQGIGKKVFNNVFFELLVGYSSKNISDIEDFVGKFNIAIENQLLAIANEMTNFEELRMSNTDALKSIITENSFVINEKYVPKHEIEDSDRCYVACECNPVHCGDLQYFTKLDISQFNPRDIPMTEAKREIIRASKSKVVDEIIKHFNLFKDSIRIEQVESWRPSDMKLKKFQMAINNV
ncbi:MAG: hypothetical protein EZS28_010094 [Streblomastix strix]|uniref:NrS-1 polymerase-like helicase domain-containing protein n=1 Tax=Streblomastix strix TaxID=222440 RepID=A0A5J4WJ42_9EUKA|nr:MAG: hypothetical protein EZS28_010094 [Streblomastix strix]